MSNNPRPKGWSPRAFFCGLWVRRNPDTGERYLAGYPHHWLIGQNTKLLIVKSNPAKHPSRNPPDFEAVLMRARYEDSDPFNTARPDYYDPALEKERRQLIEQWTKERLEREGKVDWIQDVMHEHDRLEAAMHARGKRVALDALDETKVPHEE